MILQEGRVPTVINGRFLLESRPTGTHRSALGFARALLDQRDHVQLSICTDTNRLAAGVREQLDQVEWVHTSLSSKVHAHLWEQLLLPLARDAVQLYPLNTGPFLLPAARQLLFIHDLHFLTAPHFFSMQFRLWNRFASALAAKRGRNLICFTEHVKKDLVNHLQIDPQRVSVVPQGPGIDLSAPPIETADIPDRFFLCVGGLQPHKNLKTALAAFASSGLPEDGYKLVIIGRRQGNFAAFNVSEELMNAPWLQFTGYLSDGNLVAYYQRAIGLIYISLMEGFGLPLVESFHLGCPVITSNLSCLPEVAGRAALLVDPRDVDAVAMAMRQLAGDPALRVRLIQEGKARAELYTWRRAGEAVVKEILRVAHDA